VTNKNGIEVTAEMLGVILARRLALPFEDYPVQLMTDWAQDIIDELEGL
jgi:hypothetical protein